MKAEQIKEITEKATEQLVAALEAGQSEALARYLKTIGRFHRYSLPIRLVIVDSNSGSAPGCSHGCCRNWRKTYATAGSSI